jgi:hypothetical protein
MATVTTFVRSSSEAVFAVLANGWYYSGWVVGTSHMRAVEDEWPGVGSRVFHSSGVWPAVLDDETQVEEVSVNERLVMTARGRPFGEARIEVVLVAENGGTKVTLEETPISGPGAWLDNPITEKLLYRRNIEALTRLTAIAENRTRPEG